jgi:hypothetical protein
LVEAGRHSRPQPLQPATQPRGVGQALVHTPLEELAHQHPAAQARGAQRLAKHSGHTAAKGSGVDLEQSLRLGQQAQRNRGSAARHHCQTGLAGNGGQAGGHRRRAAET